MTLPTEERIDEWFQPLKGEAVIADSPTPSPSVIDEGKLIVVGLSKRLPEVDPGNWTGG